MAYFDDTFTGLTGVPPGPKWRRIAGDPVIDGNRLKLNTTAGDQVSSVFGFAGDFDVQVDFDVSAAPASNSWNLQFVAYIDATHQIYIAPARYGGTNSYQRGKVSGGSWNYVSDFRAASSGKLRIVRIGTGFTVYWWDGAAWDPILASNTIGSAGDTCYIRCLYGMWDTNPDANGYFDNFKINSGVATGPALNDFSGDARCAALWRFESGLSTRDSKGANTLTAYNTPTEDLVDFKEGACCAVMTLASSEYFAIADAALAAGFPLKSGDATKVFSACLWFKATSFPAAGGIILSKRDSSTKWTFILSTWASGALYLYWVYNSGGASHALNIGYTLVTGRWYHIGLAIDGVNKTLYVRIWDDTAGAVVKEISFTPTNALYVSNAAFGIGASGTGEAPINGKMDEVVVFNALLTSTEIDLIRSGAFPSVAGVGTLKVFQEVAQVEWLDPPLLKTSQVIGQVEWLDPSLLKVSQVIGQVEYDPIPPPLPPNRLFPIPNPKTRWQSQTGKRVFPVVC